MADDSTVAVLEASREAAMREKKETLILVFQKYVELASAHTTACDAQGVDPTATPWWRWVVGFFREVSRVFKEDIEEVKFTIDAIIFPPTVDERIAGLWADFKALSELHQDDVA
ncbi:Nuclear cap-binding protein subunit 1 [Polyrhizophydium stewartii]|uniref:Nuclear cap-binding protein subunit 1 n=1 Tax=Polyrhizophydium stewartii TaxID=2732419 RepID=A0ABR4NGH0_9FUNG